MTQESVEQQEQTEVQEQPQQERQLSLGERSVGLTLDGPQDPNIEMVKRIYAAAIDQVAAIALQSADQEVRRLCTVAITETQGACMWAIKTITWKV